MLKRIIASTLITFSVLLGSSFLIPQQVFACSPAPGDGGLSSLVFTPWYKYLQGEEEGDPPVCRVKMDADAPAKTASLILIAIIELLTRLAAIVAVGFIIYGAFQYLISQGEAQSLSNAKSTIANSIVGLVITLLAIAIVQMIGRVLSGT